MGEIMTAHIRFEDYRYPADICTKFIPGGMQKDRFVDQILCDCMVRKMLLLHDGLS
jgi:hypothetical protein